MKRPFHILQNLIWAKDAKDPVDYISEIRGDLRELIQRQESMQKLQERQIIVNRRIAEDTVKVLQSLQDLHEKARVERRSEIDEKKPPP